MKTNVLHWVVVSVFGVGATLLTAGCSDPRQSSGSGSSCSFTYQCEDGLVCVSSKCVDPTQTQPSCEELGNCPPPTCEELGNCPPPTCEELGNCPVDPEKPECTTNAECKSPLVCRNERCTAVVPLATDYSVCTDDLDCGVGLGNCVRTLTLSAAAGGVTTIEVSEIDASIPEGKGICTRSCTTDPNVCSTLSVNAPAGVDGRYSCQVVHVGQTPYEKWQEDGSIAQGLDLAAMGRGTAFAAVCRPPFHLSSQHSSRMCQPCTGASDCESSDACYIESPHAAAPAGSCVSTCETNNDCVFGFECGAVAGATGNFCVPTSGTCGTCVDKDGDKFGAGVCGNPRSPNLGVDCDDSDAQTYFTGNQPNPTLPNYCGPMDRNCNGVTDSVERIGTANHCQSCGDVCSPTLPGMSNATFSCNANSANNGFSCDQKCNSGFLDCNANAGCETAITADMMWFSDSDGDGFGRNTTGRGVCPSEAAQLAGNGGKDANGLVWIKNPTKFDCNDDDATVFPGAIEICDGKRQNCDNSSADINAQGHGDACSFAGLVGECAKGIQACTATGLVCNAIQNGPQAETCDALDNNCDGATDNIPVPDGCVPTLPSTPDWRPLGACLRPTGVCVPVGDDYTQSCSFYTPQAAESRGAADDYNCDGYIGDASKTIFVALAGSGDFSGNDSNTGTPSSPVATLARAISLSCAGRQAGTPCKDIVMQAGEFTSTSAVTIPAIDYAFSGAAITIHGGYSIVCDADAANAGHGCQPQWRAPASSSLRSTISRTITSLPNATIANGVTTGAMIPILQGSTGTQTQWPSLALENIKISANINAVANASTRVAPTLVGIQCPSTGCGVLRFTNSTIDLSHAPDGYTPPDIAGTFPPAASGSGGFDCNQDDCTDFKGDTTFRYETTYLRGGVPSVCSSPTAGLDEAKRLVAATSNFNWNSTCAYRDLISRFGFSPSNLGLSAANVEAAFCRQCPGGYIYHAGNRRCETTGGSAMPASELLGRNNRAMWRFRLPSTTPAGRGGEPGGGREFRPGDGFVTNDSSVRYFGAMPGGAGVGTGGGAAGRPGHYVWLDRGADNEFAINSGFNVPMRNAGQNSSIRIPYYQANHEIQINATSGSAGANGSQGTYTASNPNIAPRISNGAVQMGYLGSTTTPSNGGGGGGGGGGAGCTDDEGEDNHDCGGVGVSRREYEGVGGGGGAGGCGGLAGANAGSGGSVIGILFIPSIEGSGAIAFLTPTTPSGDSLSVTLGRGGNGGKGSSGIQGQAGGAGGSKPNGFPDAFNGAAGGNGGYGGGGVGGHGGQSIGILLYCPGATIPECRAYMPSRLSALPDAYITLASSVASGGDGGASGTNGPVASRGAAGRNALLEVITAP